MSSLEEILATRGRAEALKAIRRTILARPERADPYRGLAGLLDLDVRPDRAAVADALARSCIYAGDDPQHWRVLLHKEFQAGVDRFFRCAERLAGEERGDFWPRCYRVLIGRVLGADVGPDDVGRLRLAGRFADETLALVETLPVGLPVFHTRRDLFRHCIAAVNARPDGFFAEFGVAQGTSARHIAGLLDGGQLHAFDTFQGLPADWEEVPKGEYSTGGVPPALPGNVVVHVGLFADTIPRFCGETPGRMAFAHIDCDLYESTRDVLFGLRDRITAGAVIVFDEYFGYEGFWRHEKHAFEEFLAATRLAATPLAIGPFTKQMAFEIAA